MNKFLCFTCACTTTRKFGYEFFMEERSTLYIMTVNVAV